MSELGKVRRRRFLGGVAGVMAAGYGRMAFGYPANDAIRVGLIGTGGRCMGELLPEMKKIEGLRIAAVCDVWDERLERARKETSPDVLATKDYAEVLARKDIDAVIVATPDHLHVPITIAACEAGKDVYVEKPLTHDLSEGEAVIAAEAKHGRIIQVGMQQRSMPQFQKAHEIVRAGGLGKIHRIHLSWNRNAAFGEGRPKYGIRPETVDWKRFLGSARDQPFDEVKFRNWRWFWDFGGGILTDLMVHFIDVANWFCDLDAPAAAVTLGENFITKGFWETPDTIETVLSYPDRQIQLFFEGTFVNATRGAHIEFMGRDATLYLDRGRYEIRPEKGKGSPTEFVPGTGARGADFDPNVKCGLLHMTNWVECVRSRKKPNAPATAGVIACKGAHLGNLALRKGGAARWEDIRRA